MLVTTVWQWILEGVYNLFLLAFFALVAGKSRLLNKFYILIMFCLELIMVSFYLLGDSRFQGNVNRVGALKAMVYAILQKYD